MNQDPNFVVRHVSDINAMVIHCSGSDHTLDDNVHSIRALHQMPKHKPVMWKGKKHIPFGWREVGYNHIITKDGELHSGRSILYQGAHCPQNGMNRRSISVCLTGEFHFTKAQFKTLNRVITECVVFFDLDAGEVYPHSHFNKHKTCPNFSLKEVYKWTNHPNTGVNPDPWNPLPTENVGGQ